MGDKKALKRALKSEGVFIELNFQDGLEFIHDKLADIDYIILDINLPAYPGIEPNSNVLNLLIKWYGYEASDDGEIGDNIVTPSAKLQEKAGYHLYIELIFKLGFPENNILFCSNHGNDLKFIKEAFDEAKIEMPKIYTKQDKENIQPWIKERYENQYSRLRRGIIEGCKYAKSLLTDSLYFNNFTAPNESIQSEDLLNYIEILENFLPLREPENKKSLYKLFIRTLSHEWEAAKSIKPNKEKPDAVLAWIMRNTRHWMTHNSLLFSEADEKLLAYLFIVNMRVMFDSKNNDVQKHEGILLKLFENEVLSDEDFQTKTIPISTAYLDLKNIVLNENQNKNQKDTNIEDAFYFNELANNIQLSKSPRRNDKELFTKLLYQMFWLTTSNPFIDTKNRRLLEIKFWDFKYTGTPYMYELAKHIYHHSFPQGENS